MPETTLKLPSSWGIYVGLMSNWAKQFPEWSPIKPEEWDELKGHLDGTQSISDERLQELLSKIRDL